MSNSISTTASNLRAIIYFIDLAHPGSILLLAKMQRSLGDKQFSKEAFIGFGDNNDDILAQEAFHLACQRGYAFFFELKKACQNDGALILTTARALQVILNCYIDCPSSPKVAFDNDELAIPLIARLRSDLGKNFGDTPRVIRFEENEQDHQLRSQFVGIVGNVVDIFQSHKHVTQS